MSGGPRGDAFVVEMTEFSTDAEVDEASFRWAGQYVDAAVAAAEWTAEWRRNRPRDEESLTRPANSRICVLRGTHDGPFFGMPATGRAVAFSSVEIYRISDALLAEEWVSPTWRA